MVRGDVDALAVRIASMALAGRAMSLVYPRAEENSGKGDRKVRGFFEMFARDLFFAAVAGFGFLVGVPTALVLGAAVGGGAGAIAAYLVPPEPGIEVDSRVGTPTSAVVRSVVHTEIVPAIGVQEDAVVEEEPEPEPVVRRPSTRRKTRARQPAARPAPAPKPNPGKTAEPDELDVEGIDALLADFDEPIERRPEVEASSKRGRKGKRSRRTDR